MSGNEDWNRERLEGKARRSGIPSRQLDPGGYRVGRKGPDGSTEDVGEVFVEGEGARRIEHYVLFEEHESPDALHSMVVAQGARMHASLPAFFAAMRERVAGRRFTYIKATCDYFDDIPEM